MNKIRLDKILNQMFPDWSRTKIQTLIESGNIQLNLGQWRVESRPGSKFDPLMVTPEKIKIIPLEELDFVSRGALKLQKAIEEFAIKVEGKTCLDVGLSTGGFSDFLLQKGAQKILGVDVGKDQLHPKLKTHPSLTYRDKFNAREKWDQKLLNEFFGEKSQLIFDIIVVDVSFISLDKIIPNLVSLMGNETRLVTLLKPQFELTKADLNKKGVVKDPDRIQEALEKIFEVLRQNKLEMVKYCPSPIEGENGNKEYFILSRIDRNDSSSRGL